jgi:hypothetical protein
VGVEKVQLGVHKPRVAAETLLPPEAIALTMTGNRSDCDRRSSGWDCARSMMDVMEMVRMTASGRMHMVSITRGDSACNY